MKIITIFLVLVINSLLLVWLLGGCGSSSSSSSSIGSWTVTMTGVNSGSITFSNGLSPSQYITASSNTFPNSAGNIYVSAGNSAGGPCRLVNNSVIMIGNSVSSSTIPFIGNCTGALTSTLQIGLGNSTAAVIDRNNNSIVPSGTYTLCTITAPGNAGASCTVNY